jgi:hypothetical protein
MRYKDWIKVGQMTDKEVLNDIELLVGALKGNYKDDTLFEDYVEIREIVTGKGSVDKMTHGEFLGLLEDLIKREFDSVAENYNLRRENKQLKSENAITKLEKELDEANMRNINLRGENKQLKAANFKYTLRISQIESVCVDAWEEQE